MVVENPKFNVAPPPPAPPADNPPVEAHQPDLAETSASLAFGQAEPGHDVFGVGEAEKKAKSDAAAKEAAASESQAKNSVSMITDASSTATEAQAVTDAEKLVESSTDEVAGPVFFALDDEALAAEKVRNELFPDE